MATATSPMRIRHDEPIDLPALRANWTAVDYAHTGRRIFHAVPADQQPAWAGEILRHAARGDPLCPELATVADLSLAEDRWAEAHAAYTAIRQLAIRNKRRRRPDRKLALLLDIGETAAKVVYNASKPLSPFEYHAGWRMAPRLKRLADHVGEHDFEDHCWSLLTRT